MRTQRGSEEEIALPAQEYILSDQIGHILRRVYQRHIAIFQQAIPDRQLTSVQFAVLVTVRDAGPASLTKVGEATAIDPATLRGVVSRLTERGLLLVADDPEDGRARLLTLTTSGDELLDRLVPSALEVSQATLKPLNCAERIALLYLLKRMAGDA